MYFNGMFNSALLDDAAEYAIFDDFSDWNKFYMYKQWLGAQKQFTITDKYVKKLDFMWGKPCIILSNSCPDFPDLCWVSKNAITVEVISLF